MVRQNRILIWLIVLLVILNVTTIGTIIYHNYNERQQQDDQIIINTEGQMINGRYMRQHLAFDNDQIDLFREANRDFRPQAFNIISSIDSLKSEMFIELNKAENDTVKLNQLSAAIGSLHAKLKQDTYRFYLKIKSICTSGQQKKLEVVFAPLFKNEGMDFTPGPYHNRMGRGSGWFNNKN